MKQSPSDQPALNLRAAPALGYSREGDIVTVRLTIDDFEALLMCLGAAAATGTLQNLSLRTANAVNAGRPLSEWRPYAVREEGANG